MGVALHALLDTHAFLWWLDDDPSLSSAADQVIRDAGTTVFVSAATAWEITTKFRLGRLPDAAVVAADVDSCIAGQGFTALPITVAHAQRAGGLPGLHGDPFDRMLIAQALAEGCALVSNERLFDRYGVTRLW